MDLSILSGQAQVASVTAADVKVAVRQINREIDSSGSFLDFSVDKQSGLTVVKVIDRNTKEVVKQFPAEEIVQMARTLNKLRGILAACSRNCTTHGN